MATIRLDPRAVRATMTSFARRNTRDVADRVIEQARRLSPVDTGRYRAAWSKREVTTVRGVGWQVFNPVPYAEYIENGTRPHVIRPKRQDGTLRFRIGGKVVYAKIVHHPGTKAQHVLAKATRQVAGAAGYNVRVTG